MTAREIELITGNLRSHIDEKVADLGKKLDSIETQTNKTNGRVKNLEIWRSFLMGAMMVITSLVIPLVIYIWITSHSLDNTVQQSINSAFGQYDIKVVK